MGYYTNYKIKVIISGDTPGILSVSDAIACFKKAAGEDAYLMDLCSNEAFWCNENGDFELNAEPPETKWYEWEKDCIALSLAIPNCVIYLAGEGEEALDIWKAVIKNGKCTKSEAKITFWGEAEAAERDEILAETLPFFKNAGDAVEYNEFKRLAKKFADYNK